MHWVELESIAQGFLTKVSSLLLLLAIFSLGERRRGMGRNVCLFNMFPVGQEIGLMMVCSQSF